MNKSKMALDGCSKESLHFFTKGKLPGSVKVLSAFAFAWSVWQISFALFAVTVASNNQQISPESEYLSFQIPKSAIIEQPGAVEGTITQPFYKTTLRTRKLQKPESYPRVVRFDSTFSSLVDHTTTNTYQQQDVVFRRFNSAAEILESYSVLNVPVAKLNDIWGRDPEMDPFLEAPAQSKGYEKDMKNMERYAPNQYANGDFERHCVPMKEWQTKSFPTCNTFHEIQYSQQLVYLAEGGWRYTFSLQDNEDVVIKMYLLKDGYKYDFRPYEMHRVDALVSERLTASPYVMDIYGYCGLTAMYEKGRFSIENKIKSPPKKLPDQTELSNQNLKWSYQLAQGIADMHSIDFPQGNNSTVANCDIRPSNVMIARNGVAKLSDFNLAILRYWNVTSNKKCPFYYNKFPVFWGTGFKPIEQADLQPLEDSVDVFALGGVLYNILTGAMPYYEVNGKRNEMRAAMEKGVLPTIPSPFNATDAAPEVKVIRKLIHECMVVDSAKRPSSKYVSDQLKPFVEDI